MPLNLLKEYNKVLDLYHSTERQNLSSLKGVFNREFIEKDSLKLNNIPIHPTTSEDGEDKMEVLFRHLTTVITDEATRKREFEGERSIRIHWIRFLLENNPSDNLLLFNIMSEKRVYCLDKSERYVIILEPLRNTKGFYLLTAYRLEPSNYRNLMNKYEKRGKDGLPEW
jgi:hypothetical protein